MLWSCRVATRGDSRGDSRWPRAPAPVAACVEASYGPRRGAVVRARDVSLETETSSKTQSRWRSVPSAGRRSRVPRRRLRRRGEPFGTSALARRGRSAVRGRVGQSPSIHLEPARCRRDARDPILIEEAQRTLPRRHAPPERRRARRLAHGVAGHDLARLALAAAVAAAAGAVLRGRRRSRGTNNSSETRRGVRVHAGPAVQVARRRVVCGRFYFIGRLRGASQRPVFTCSDRARRCPRRSYKKSGVHGRTDTPLRQGRVLQ